MGTFSFGDYPKDCDMSATLRDIGATFCAITVTKCDMGAHGAGVCAPVSEYGAGCGAGCGKG